MKYWTYGEIKAKVQKDLGIEDEDFISEQQLLSTCNEAIEEVEKEIHTLYEDYFLTDKIIRLEDGKAYYNLPSDIFANKIRGIIYNDGNTIFPIRKFKEKDKFLKIEELDRLDSDVYRYLIINRNISGIPTNRLRLVPRSKETFPAYPEWESLTSYNVDDVVFFHDYKYVCTEANSDEYFDSDKWTESGEAEYHVKISYIRNANKMVDDDSICDIPEFISFIFQSLKCAVYEKEHNEALPMALEKLERMRISISETLRDMIVDDDTDIEMDLSIYEDAT
jgi:hypothetical protein